MATERMKSSLVFLYGVSLATACLITNCPPGGKRAFYDYLVKSPNKATARDQPSQCIKCGPGGDGRCIGPTMCCGPHIGCLMGSPGLLAQCSGLSLTPPSTAPTCPMPSGIGICTIDGICCDSESCRFESMCEADPYFSFCPDDISENENMHLQL